MFGEPIPQRGAVQNYENDPTVQVMNNLGIKVARLPRKITGVALTDQQYDDYGWLAGRITKQKLDSVTGVTGFTSLERGAQIETIHKQITQARQEAANDVKARYWGRPTTSSGRRRKIRFRQKRPGGRRPPRSLSTIRQMTQ